MSEHKIAILNTSENKSDIQEQDLLYRIAEGDERAFTALFNKHWDHLYNYMMRVTKSHEVSEEIVVDVFLKLWMGKELVVNIRNMEAFLSKVAHNKAMNFFNLAARDNRLQKIIAETFIHNGGQSADYRLLDKETKQVLDEAIEKLSPQRKVIFELHQIEGLSNDEIAERLNLSRQTVKNTLSDAKRILQGILKEKDPGSMVILWALLMHL